MTEPYLGEVRLFSYAAVPRGWARCEGQLLPINQNQALFALLRTTYGGNGQTNFALPDLRDRVPVHADASTGLVLGARGGAQAHTLSQAEMPEHAHLLMASSQDADTGSPTGAVPAATGSAYGPPEALAPLGPSSVVPVGGTQPHTNLQPYLVLVFAIALQGIFPSRT